MLAFGKVGAGPELKTDNEHIRWERKNVHKEFSWSSTRGRADFWSEFLAPYLPTSHKARQTGDGIRTTSCGVVVKIVDLSGSVDSQKNKNNNNNNNCHLHLSPQHHHHLHQPQNPYHLPHIQHLPPLHGSIVHQHCAGYLLHNYHLI